MASGKNGAWRLVLMLVVAALFLSACGGGDGSDDSSTVAEETESEDSGEPVEGGTLTLAVEADVRETDNIQLRIVVDKVIMGSTVYDSLFQTDENAQPQPSLATEATPSDDLMEWTVTLRDGVTFHNGSPFTAEDVVQNIEAYLDPANASPLAGDIGIIDSVEEVDDTTVKFTLAEPASDFPALFMDAIYMGDMTDDGETPVGTGPYQWGRHVAGDSLRFSRFDDHWRGRPPLDEVVFRVIPESQVAALELQSGNVDWVVQGIAPEAVPTFRDKEDFQVHETPGGIIYQTLFNFEKARNGGYEDDKAFREGMAYLWNAEELVPPLIGEFGTVQHQPVPPWQLGYDEDYEPRPYDPEKGKELLAKAGIQEGDPIKLVVWTRPFNCEHATVFQSQLKELGYDAQLECVMPEAAMGTVGTYDWDMLWVRLGARATAALTLHTSGFYSGLAPDPLNDMYTYRDEEFDSLIAEMRTTTEEDAYKELSSQVIRKLLVDDVATLPAYIDMVRYVAKDRVKGIKLSPIGYHGLLMNGLTTVYVED